MRALAFWKAVTVDRSNMLERVVEILKRRGVRYCLIGGQAVNAYAEPVVSLDLDIVVATDQREEIISIFSKEFSVERFERSVNVSLAGSDLRVQIQTNPRYAPFVERASSREVLGMVLLVARLEDVLEGKVWAAQDPTRRGSKRQKDLADIARLLETHPHLRANVPKEILDRLL